MDAKTYAIVKADVLDAIECITKYHAAAGAYLREHVEMDDEAQTFCYTGDDRIKLARSAAPPFDMTVQVREADRIRITRNVYGNPITVGKVYPVVEWRKIGRRKGLFPRIVDDGGRTITMDDVKNYETVYAEEE